MLGRSRSQHAPPHLAHRAHRAHRAAREVAALLALLLALALAAVHAPAWAQQGPSFPPLTGRVTDAADMIPPDVESRIDQKLQALESQTGHQLVVATIPDLQGYDIADYGYQLGRAWGIGSKEKNDGALLIVAPRERELRIEVGYGLEGVLTDGMSSLIINQTIVPKFKDGDLPGGIEAGTDAIIHQLGLPPGEARQIAQQAGQQANDDFIGIPPDTLMMVLFFGAIIMIQFVIPLVRTVYQRRRYPGGTGRIFIYDLLANMPRSSSGSGGGSSGGGFSGGGGSFGGGGASGRW